MGASPHTTNVATNTAAASRASDVQTSGNAHFDAIGLTPIAWTLGAETIRGSPQARLLTQTRVARCRTVGNAVAVGKSLAIRYAFLLQNDSGKANEELEQDELHGSLLRSLSRCGQLVKRVR